MKFKLSRTTALVGAVAVAAGVLLTLAGPANAALVGTPVGSDTGNGNLTFSPSSGLAGAAPTWHTLTACPAADQSGAALFVNTTDVTGPALISPSVAGVLVSSPFSGTISGGDLGAAVLGSFVGPTSFPNTYELVVGCKDSSAHYHYVQDAFVTFTAAGDWSISATSTVQDNRPAATVAVDAFTPSSVASGTPVTLSAHVTGTAPVVGSLQFKVDGTAVGSPVAVSAAGAVTLPNVTTGPSGLISDGAHTVTAAFTAAASPTSAVKDGADTVGSALNIQGAAGENLTVNVQADEGTFTYTVQTSPTVVLNPATGAGIDSKGHLGSFGSGTFNYAAPMNPVTVHDFRQQSKPGWHVNGVVSNFLGVSGAGSGKTIPGGDLGWHPIVTSQTSGVTAGPDVTPGAASPTLFGTATGGIDTAFTGGSDLAAAAVGGGQNDTVLNANLSLVVPDSTLPGTYNATLTFTAIDHP